MDSLLDFQTESTHIASPQISHKSPVPPSVSTPPSVTFILSSNTWLCPYTLYLGNYFLCSLTDFLQSTSLGKIHPRRCVELIDHPSSLVRRFPFCELTQRISPSFWRWSSSEVVTNRADANVLGLVFCWTHVCISVGDGWVRGHMYVSALVDASRFPEELY